MKFFVTDAQLAALRATAAEAAWEDYRRTLAVLSARHDAEVTRLREDRREELARLADPAGPFVAHLIAEVEWSRLQYAYERQRADVSIDQRLAERGLGPATIPPRSVTPETGKTTDDLMAELLKNTDFAAMGRNEGVER